MQTKSSFKLLATALTITCSLFLTLLLTNCGSGGSSGNVTIRPKTLDGLKLTLGVTSFEFIRDFSSGSAAQNGGTESGTFIYTSQGTGAQFGTIDGLIVRPAWPFSIGPAEYTYRSLNNTSGEIIIKSSGFLFLPDDDNDGTSYPYFDNADVGGSEIRILITFGTDGSVITNTDIRLEDFDTPSPSTTALMQGQLTFNGGPVTIDYIGEGDISNSESKISIKSLDRQTMVFTDDLDPIVENFSLQLTSTNPAVAGQTEIGQTIYIDASNAPIVNAANYIYNTILGTNDARLQLSGGTPNDGTIILQFTSVATPTQDGAGTYTTSGGRTGSFIVRNSQDF